MNKIISSFEDLDLDKCLNCDQSLGNCKSNCSCNPRSYTRSYWIEFGDFTIAFFTHNEMSIYFDGFPEAIYNGQYITLDFSLSNREQLLNFLNTLRNFT